MANENVKSVNFSTRREVDVILLQKLNKVAKSTGRTVHNLARHIMLQQLNKLDKENSETDYQQPASVVG